MHLLMHRIWHTVLGLVLCMFVSHWATFNINNKHTCICNMCAKHSFTFICWGWVLGDYKFSNSYTIWTTNERRHDPHPSNVCVCMFVVFRLKIKINVQTHFIIIIISCANSLVFLCYVCESILFQFIRYAYCIYVVHILYSLSISTLIIHASGAFQHYLQMILLETSNFHCPLSLFASQQLKPKRKMNTKSKMAERYNCLNSTIINDMQHWIHTNWHRQYAFFFFSPIQLLLWISLQM